MNISYIESIVEINIEFFRRLLKVKRKTTNNIYPTSASCGGISVPNKDRTIGIPNSDLHIYLIPQTSSTDAFVDGDVCAFLDYQSIFPGVTFAYIMIDPSFIPTGSGPGFNR
jgi:hypothetical protein